MESGRGVSTVPARHIVFLSSNNMFYVMAKRNEFSDSPVWRKASSSVLPRRVQCACVLLCVPDINHQPIGRQPYPVMRKIYKSSNEGTSKQKQSRK